MNRGSKLTIGLITLLGALQLVHAYTTYLQFGRIDWLKMLAALPCFGVSISGYFWLKRNPHRTE
ncbi:hypothetical protein BN8_03807 [Fibrisoma limi BUZ 3]|uniref:Uncharacterized protein n=1 Tax=Fibrisoma limi BUZ 3 TaxID=1185876 RepID=I2GL39_9BACT|nr:hypothetical protein [Fibrisoma limi]CCH54615.1 hypothetical protein BN8_03807 [Fibrisoma limi BUZ 3]